MNIKFLSILFILLSAETFCSELNEEVATIDFCSSVIISEDSVTFVGIKGVTFANKKTGLPDYLPKNYKNKQVCKEGETFRISSIGHNLYWEVLSIENGVAKMNYYGFIRGVGRVKKTLCIKSYVSHATTNKLIK